MHVQNITSYVTTLRWLVRNNVITKTENYVYPVLSGINDWFDCAADLASETKWVLIDQLDNLQNCLSDDFFVRRDFLSSQISSWVNIFQNAELKFIKNKTKHSSQQNVAALLLSIIVLS